MAFCQSRAPYVLSRTISLPTVQLWPVWLGGMVIGSLMASARSSGSLNSAVSEPSRNTHITYISWYLQYSFQQSIADFAFSSGAYYLLAMIKLSSSYVRVCYPSTGCECYQDIGFWMFLTGVEQQREPRKRVHALMRQSLKFLSSFVAKVVTRSGFRPNIPVALSFS
jgi:hypothetical protein